MPLIISVGAGATGLDSIKMNSQQRLFYRNGNYYLFWFNPINHVISYRFSTTIALLASATDIVWFDPRTDYPTDFIRGGGWDIYYDSSLDEIGIVILEYAYLTAAYTFRFWYCNFNVDNTINSVNFTTYVPVAGVHDFIHLTRTNTGIWIISSFHGSSTKDHRVFRSTDASGTGWGNDINDPYAGSLFADNIMCSKIGTTGNKYVAIGCRTDEVIYAKYFNGTTVGSLISSAFVRSTMSAPANDPSAWSSPVVDSFGDVHIVAVEETTYDLYHLTFSSSTLLWATELISATNDYRAPSLAIDANNYLYVIVRASTSFFLFSNNSGTWVDNTSLMNADFTAVHDTSSDTPVMARSSANELIYAWYSSGIWVDGKSLDKYELTATSKVVSGHTVYQIIAILSFSDVSVGDLGGWVESGSNLSQSGDCWLYDNAVAYESSVVDSDARVSENTRIYGTASITGSAAVYGNAWVFGTSIVSSNAVVRACSRVNNQNVGLNEIIETACPATIQYWVADTTANWNSTANWDTTSGGPGGSPVPTIDTTVVFDLLGLGSCVLDTTPQVAYMIIDGYTGSFLGDCTTTNMDLLAGCASAGADTTVHVLGDVLGSIPYGSWTPSNNLPIEFNGSGVQKLTNSIGCIFPVLDTNKSVPQQVVCYGDSPFLVNGGFLIHDGTFNMNGRDLQVGI
jgi:hypothetical protein